MATNRESLLRCVQVMHHHYGPTSEHAKTAAARYFEGLTQPSQDDEILGSKFVKLARAQGADPWTMAFQVAQGYDNLVKTAEVLPLSRYYVEWASEFEKNASSLAGIWRGAKNVASQAGARFKAGREAGGVLHGLTRASGTNVGGAMRRGVQSAEREAGAVKAFKQQALEAPGTQHLAKPAPIPKPASTTAPAAPTGTPSGTPAAEPQKPNWGHVAAGAGALGVVGAGAYGMSRVAKRPAAGQAPDQFAGQYAG